MTSDLSRAIDELYGVPPKEFSAARNAKAAALKAAGHAEEARSVRQLGKPSPFLWAANQLGRQDRERVAHFVDVVNRTRQSQLRDPRTAAEGMKAIRTELQALTNRAAEILSAAGYRVSPASAARISNTVLAAAVDSDLVDDLRHGRLSAELPAPGFEVLAGSDGGRRLRLVHGGRSAGARHAAEPDSAAERDHGATRDRADARREHAEAKREQAEARRREVEARRAQEQAERERLAQEIAALRRDAEQRKTAAEQAVQEVRRLEQQLADARRTLRAAEREADAAARRARRRTHS